MYSKPRTLNSEKENKSKVYYLSSINRGKIIVPSPTILNACSPHLASAATCNKTYDEINASDSKSKLRRSPEQQKHNFVLYRIVDGYYLCLSAHLHETMFNFWWFYFEVYKIHVIKNNFDSILQQRRNKKFLCSIFPAQTKIEN